MHVPSACCNHEVRYAELNLCLLISYKTILLPCPHSLMFREQSCHEHFQPGAEDSEAVYKVEALLGWKTGILASIGSVAKVGKGRTAFQVTEFMHTLQGVFKHLQLHYLTCFYLNLVLDIIQKEQ